MKRFKQSQDVVKSHMGSKWLETFVEHTEEYQKATDSTHKLNKKPKYWKVHAFVLLRNNDQAKYQSLTNGLISQYSMENEQSPKTITAATDIFWQTRNMTIIQ